MLRAPRRLNPIAFAGDSSHVEQFWSHVHRVVGPRLIYTPIYQLGKRQHGWHIGGPEGSGLLLESDDKPQPRALLRTRSLFIGRSWGGQAIDDGRRILHLWDAKLAVAQGAVVPALSRRQLYRYRDERTRQLAETRDSLVWPVVADDGHAVLSGFDTSIVSRILTVHVIHGPLPNFVSLTDGFLREHFKCHHCDWVGLGSAIAATAIPTDPRMHCPACDAVLCELFVPGWDGEIH